MIAVFYRYRPFPGKRWSSSSSRQGKVNLCFFSRWNLIPDNLSRENKNLNEKIKSINDYSSIKKEVFLYLREKVVNLENENGNVGLQNINLQKQIEKLIENLASENKKYENTKLEVNC